MQVRGPTLEQVTVSVPVHVRVPSLAQGREQMRTQVRIRLRKCVRNWGVLIRFGELLTRWRSTLHVALQTFRGELPPPDGPAGAVV
eukprot:716513-Pleurochrysis_carterae.AAC.1